MLADFEYYTQDKELPPPEYIKTKVNTQPLENTPFVAPYVPIDNAVCKIAIEFAHISANDRLVDLGCGDGRILQMALDSSTPPKSVVGVEFDELLVEYIHKTHPRIEIIYQDMFTVHLESLEASVAILYLLPKGLEKLQSILGDWLCNDKDRRLVTVGYAVPAFVPVSTQTAVPQDTFMGGSDDVHQKLYYYNYSSIINISLS